MYGKTLLVVLLCFVLFFIRMLLLRTSFVFYKRGWNRNRVLVSRSQIFFQTLNALKRPEQRRLQSTTTMRSARHRCTQEELLLSVLDYLPQNQIMPVRLLASALPDYILVLIADMQGSLLSYLYTNSTSFDVFRDTDGVFKVKRSCTKEPVISRLCSMKAIEKNSATRTKAFHKTKSEAVSEAFWDTLLPHIPDDNFLSIKDLYQVLTDDEKKDCRSLGGLGNVLMRNEHPRIMLSNDKCHVVRRREKSVEDSCMLPVQPQNDLDFPDDPEDEDADVPKPRGRRTPIDLTSPCEAENVELDDHGIPIPRVLWDVLHEARRQDQELLKKKHENPTVRDSPKKVLRDPSINQLVKYIPTYPIVTWSVQMPEGVCESIAGYKINQYDFFRHIRHTVLSRDVIQTPSTSRAGLVFLSPLLRNEGKGDADKLYRNDETLKDREALLRAAIYDLFAVKQKTAVTTDEIQEEIPETIFENCFDEPVSQDVLVKFLRKYDEHFSLDGSSKTVQRTRRADPRVELLDGCVQQVTIGQKKSLLFHGRGTYANPDILGKALRDLCPETGWSDLRSIVRKLPEEAQVIAPLRCMRTISSMSKYISVSEGRPGVLRIQRASGATSQDIDFDSTMYNERLFVRLLYRSIPKQGACVKGLLNRWTTAAREAIRSLYGNINKFILDRPEYFRIEYVNHGRTLYVYLTLPQKYVETCFPEF